MPDEPYGELDAVIYDIPPDYEPTLMTLAEWLEKTQEPRSMYYRRVPAEVLAEIEALRSDLGKSRDRLDACRTCLVRRRREADRAEAVIAVAAEVADSMVYADNGYYDVTSGVRDKLRRALAEWQT